jgi:hypothetical protein
MIEASAAPARPGSTPAEPLPPPTSAPRPRPAAAPGAPSYPSSDGYPSSPSSTGGTGGTPAPAAPLLPSDAVGTFRAERIDWMLGGPPAGASSSANTSPANGAPMSLNWKSVAIGAAVAIVVWKYVLKK